MKPTIAKPKDLREYAIVPIRAIRDPRLKPRTFQVLVAFCSYADRTGRTFVSLKKIGQDLGVTDAAIAHQVRTLTKLGYMKKAKQISPYIKSATRRIIYRHTITEETIRSRLSPEHQMELAESEARLKAHAKQNTQPDQGEIELRERFVVSLAQLFSEALASGWWMSADSLHRAPIQLAEQAVGCLVRDRDAPQSDGEGQQMWSGPRDG